MFFFFALPFWGAYIWKDFCKEWLIFGILRYVFPAAANNNAAHLTGQMASLPFPFQEV